MEVLSCIKVAEIDRMYIINTLNIQWKHKEGIRKLSYPGSIVKLKGQMGRAVLKFRCESSDVRKFLKNRNFSELFIVKIIIDRHSNMRAFT